MSDAHNPAPEPQPADEASRGWLARRADAILDAAHGRHTLFAGAFFVMGNVWHYFHRLDGVYIGFMGSLMAFVLGHSVKDDYFSK